MADTPKWGWYSFASGLQVPEVKTLVELARRGGDDLMHVINVLLNSGSQTAEIMAEDLFDTYAQGIRPPTEKGGAWVHDLRGTEVS